MHGGVVQAISRTNRGNLGLQLLDTTTAKKVDEYSMQGPFYRKRQNRVLVASKHS